MNTTTAITLNDRFSMIKKHPSQTSMAGAGRARSRSRSRSRNRSRQSSELRGSHKSQLFLKQLERRQKMTVANKLKNKSIMTSRGRAQGQIIRNQAKLAGVIRKTLASQLMRRRANSQTRFVPLNDAPSRMSNRGRSRSRSRSRSRNRIQNTGSIQDRLGVRKGPSRMRRSIQNGGGQQQFQRQQQFQQQQQRGRSRSRSRNRLNRGNFQSQNAAPPRRSNSVNGRMGNNNGPVRNRSRGRNNKSKAALVRRSGSVNGRFSSVNVRNGNRINRNSFNRPVAGRIVKRNINRKVNGARKPNAIGNAAARNAKKLQRGGNNNQQARGRARNRGQNNQGGGGGGAGNGNGGQRPPRRGRSRTRRSQNNRGGGGGGQGGGKKISKEQLDKQLDEYMSKA